MSETMHEEPAKMRLPDLWHLRNLPPEGHADVGPFFYKLFEDALAERDRQNLRERWLANHQLYYGNHFSNIFGLMSKKSKGKLSLGLLTSNINKTVANLTARSPVCDVNIGDGVNDDEDRIIRQKFTQWNGTEVFQLPLQRSALNMELYGITIEKAVYDVNDCITKYVVVDPFSFVCCPGYYSELNDAPYLMHMSAEPVEEVRARYEIGGEINIDYDELYSILGEEREDQRHVSAVGGSQGTGNYGGNFVPTKPLAGDDAIRSRRCLVIEVWIRDFSAYDGEVPLIEAGNEELYKHKYPGCIRVVTFTNYGNVVLSDISNPNVNDRLLRSKTRKTYLYDHFPFFKSNAMEDGTSIYGFSKGELVGDINIAVDSIWSNIVYYLNMSLFPPIIIPKDSKVPTSTIRYKPRLIIEPISTATAGGIKWLQLPTPPSWLFQALDTLLKFFDRISGLDSIDADASNGGVIAASALELMQERASIMIQGEIRAIDYLVRCRGRCAISNYLNFGADSEVLTVDGEEMEVRGIDLCGKSIEYIVESGSTIAKSNIQARAQALQLFQLQAIDAQALLEVLQFPNWRSIVRRMAQQGVDGALQLLQQAGLPPESCVMIKQALLQLTQQEPMTPEEAAAMVSQAPEDHLPGDPNQPAPAAAGQGQKPGAAPGSGSPGGAVGAPGGQAGAPAKPGIPKAFQGQ